MQPIARNKRPGRQLLVAAIGIASVSYVGALNACADVDPGDEGQANAAEEGAPDLGESQQALTIDSVAATTTATAYKPLPTSGNLMPPDGRVTNIGVIKDLTKIKIPIPVGNLMAPVEPGPAIELDTAALAVESN